jgi:hypothetical protein
MGRVDRLRSPAAAMEPQDHWFRSPVPIRRRIPAFSSMFSGLFQQAIQFPAHLFGLARQLIVGSLGEPFSGLFLDLFVGPFRSR